MKRIRCFAAVFCLLLLLAGTVLLVRAPRIRPNAADCCAALLLAGVTASRFLLPGPAAPARYDELPAGDPGQAEQSCL